MMFWSQSRCISRKHATSLKNPLDVMDLKIRRICDSALLLSSQISCSFRCWIIIIFPSKRHWEYLPHRIFLVKQIFIFHDFEKNTLKQRLYNKSELSRTLIISKSRDGWQNKQKTNTMTHAKTLSELEYLHAFFRQPLCVPQSRKLVAQMVLPS